MSTEPDTANRTAADVAELLSLLAICVDEIADEVDREEAEAALEMLAAMNPEAAKQAKRELRRTLAQHAEAH